MTFVVPVGSGSTADVRHCPVPIAALEGIFIRLTARPVRQDISGAAGKLVVAIFAAECAGIAAERRPARITPFRAAGLPRKDRASTVAAGRGTTTTGCAIRRGNALSVLVDGALIRTRVDAAALLTDVPAAAIGPIRGGLTGSIDADRADTALDALTVVALAGGGIGRFTRAEIDTLILTASLACAALHRDALAVLTGFAGPTRMIAAATVFGINAWVDTLAVADDAVLAALALSVDAVISRWADVAASATVVGIGSNVGAHPTAADVASHAQAAIPVLTVLDPLVIEAVRGHPAAEARDEHRPIVAEVVAGGVFIEKEFANRGVLAIGDATTGCGSARSAK